MVTLLMVLWADLGVNLLKGHWEEASTAYATIYSSSITNVITLLSLGSVGADCYTFTNPLRHGFWLYTKECMEFSIDSLGNTPTIL